MTVIWLLVGLGLIDRWEGAAMLLLFGAYYYHLFINL